MDHSTGADHRSRAFQITPSVALSLSFSLKVAVLLARDGAQPTHGDLDILVNQRTADTMRYCLPRRC